MDLTYLAIMKYCGVNYCQGMNYVFIENMDDDPFYINHSTIHPGQVFVLPESYARSYVRDALGFRKLAVVAYLVKGEDRPWC